MTIIKSPNPGISEITDMEDEILHLAKNINSKIWPGFYSFAVVKQNGEYTVHPRAAIPWCPYIIVEGSTEDETRDRALWLAALLNTYGDRYEVPA